MLFLLFMLFLLYWIIFGLYLLFPLTSSIFISEERKTHRCLKNKRQIQISTPAAIIKKVPLFSPYVVFCGPSLSLKSTKKILMTQEEWGTKKLGSFWYSQNILQWSKNDIESKKSTNGDYHVVRIEQENTLTLTWQEPCHLQGKNWTRKYSEDPSTGHPNNRNIPYYLIFQYPVFRWWIAPEFSSEYRTVVQLC